MITAKTEIFYLHYTDFNNQHSYLKVHTGQKRVTLVAVTGKDGRKGKYCRGIYEIKWTTFLSRFSNYDEYWPGGKFYGKKSMEGRIIGHNLKFTSANQYVKHKIEVLKSLI